MTSAGNYIPTLKKWKSLYAPMSKGFFIPSTGPNNQVDSGRDPALAIEWPTQFDGPLPHPVKDQQGKLVCRGLVVDIAAVNTYLAEHERHWTDLTIYADVVVFPMHVFDEHYDEFSFGIGSRDDQKVTIFARTIDICDGSGTFVASDARFDLTIVADQISGGTLNILIETDEDYSIHELSIVEGTLGTTVTNNNPSGTPLRQIPTQMLETGSDVFWLLQSSFNVGSCLTYDRTPLIDNGKQQSELKTGQLSERQGLGLDILSWTSRAAATGIGEDWLALSMSAANAADLINQMRSEIPSVPVLDQVQYRNLLTELTGVVDKYETAFNTTTGKLQQIGSVHEFVAATHSNYEDRGAVIDQLITAAEKNIKNTEHLLANNNAKVHALVTIDGELEKARQAFDSGIDAYRRKKSSETTLAVATAVLEVGVSLAAMSAGDEAAAGSVAKGAEAAAKAGKEASKIKKLFETIKKIVEMMKKLKKVLEAIKKTQEAVKNLKKGVASPGGGLQVLSSDNSDVLDNAYWDVFTLTVDDIMTSGSSPLVNEIDGAQGYATKLKQLAIYGKAVTAYQITLMAQQQKLMKLHLDKQVASKMTARLDTIDTRQASLLDQLQEAKILLYQDLLRMKGRIIIYMSEHAAAYRYWAVQDELPHTLMPTLNDSILELSKKLTGLSKLRLQKMKDFDPEPQPMHQTIKIRDQEVLDCLKRTREATFTISRWNTAFQLEEHPGPGHPATWWQRVRVHSRRIYLNKETITDQSMTVKIELSTSGHYQDEYKDSGVLEYVGKDERFSFAYVPAKNRDDPVADGGPRDDFSYFEPTPFTTWTIRILNDENTLNLDQLESLELELLGGWSEVELRSNSGSL